MTELTHLHDASDLDALFERSHEMPVFVFKHSLICPISRAAFQEYRRFVAREDLDADFTLIEIQKAREVSTALAKRTGVRHESPQAILLRRGEVAWHASHGGIREEALLTALTDEA